VETLRRLRGKYTQGLDTRTATIITPLATRLAMMRVAVTLAALASASAFAPISAPTGLKLRAQNVARAPRSAGERAWTLRATGVGQR
jgi:hypothetical protein